MLFKLKVILDLLFRWLGNNHSADSTLSIQSVWDSGFNIALTTGSNGSQYEHNYYLLTNSGDLINSGMIETSTWLNSRHLNLGSDGTIFWNLEIEVLMR